MARLVNRHSVRALTDQDQNYFLNKYPGQSLKYETIEGPPMLMDLAVIIDADNDGIITEKDFDEVADITRTALKGKQSNTAELPYKHLPKAVSSVLEQWDADKSGSVGVAELVKAGEAQKKMENENRLVKRLLAGAVAVIMILMAATFALSFAAVQMAKDSRPDASGIQSLPDGSPVANAEAREVVAVSEWPSLSFDTLTRAEDFNLVYDDQAHHFRIASIEQSATLDLTIQTLDGRTVEISSGGIISVDGVIKDVSDGRRLEDGRRLWGGSLMTSGSFTMMASDGGA